MPSPQLRKTLAGLILASSLGSGLAGSSTACVVDEPAQAQPSEPPPAPVEIATATVGELVDEWIFVGEVRSLRSAELALGAGGEIVSLDVREGDRVAAGDLLVEIDKRRASAQLSAAVSSRRESEGELEQARREAERAATLGAGVLPQEEIEQQRVRAETLEARKRRLGAEIRGAQAQLSDYLLVAPFAGVVAARYADLGQWVNPGETVLELVAVDDVEILVDVRPELAAHIRVGDPANLRAGGGLSGPPATAEITGVVPSLNRATRTLKIRLSPTQARPWLLPGAPVEVGFAVRFNASELGGEVIIVPRDALVLGAVDVRVIVVVDGRAKPVQVEILATANDLALVRGAGLQAGTVVVTRGNERLRPGQAVRANQPEPSEEPST